MSVMRMLHKLRVRFMKVQPRSLTVHLAVAAGVLFSMVIGIIVFWYMPQRSDVVVGRALVASLRQSSVKFRVEMSGTAGTDSIRVDGHVNESGNFRADVSRGKGAGQRIGLLGVDGDVFMRGEDGQWLTVPAQAIDALLPVQAGTLQEQTATDRLDEVDRRRIETLYGQYQFVEVAKILPDEEIEGEPSRHYLIRINKQLLRQFLETAKQEMADLRIQDGQIADIVESGLLDRPAELWVGKNDGLIRQFVYVPYTSEESAGSGVTMRVTLFAYGEPLTVSRPPSARSLLDILQP